MDSLHTFAQPCGTEVGYQVNLKTMLPRKWQCPLCNMLMKDAIQTYRGEMACESCFLKAKGDNKICPIDNEPIEDGEFFKDRHARREILQLECYCWNKNNGCSWQGVVNENEEHKIICNYACIGCGGCKEYVQRRFMDNHVRNLCVFRKLECPHCRTMLDAQSLKEHETTCHMKPINCPYMCGEHVQLNNLYSHVENCAKVAEGHICPYQLVGCEHQPTIPEGLSHHLQKEGGMHAALTISTVICLQETNEKMKQDLMTEQKLRVELANKLEEQTNSQKEIEADMIKWRNKFQGMETEFAKLQDLCGTGVTEVENHLKQIDLRTQENSLHDIDAKLTEISQQYNDVESKLKNNLGPPAASSSGFDSEEVKQGIAKIDQLESGSAVLTANLSELELKLQLLENTCYDGRQLWKVDNVAYRMNQAVTGSVSALHSAPCFQKRGGYKFCSRLYLNGDGMGRGTHVSLFFVVMKSEYDALLQWPFAERVTFRLINPYNREESVRESFIPDRNSSSFKRPTKDMNIAAGCPMFIRKELLQNFIVGDVLYIETTITAD